MGYLPFPLQVWGWWRPFNKISEVPLLHTKILTPQFSFPQNKGFALTWKTCTHLSFLRWLGSIWVWPLTSFKNVQALEKEMAAHSSTPAWRIPWQRRLAGCSPWGHTTVWLEEKSLCTTMTTADMLGVGRGRETTKYPKAPLFNLFFILLWLVHCVAGGILVPQ